MLKHIATNVNWDGHTPPTAACGARTDGPWAGPSDDGTRRVCPECVRAEYGHEPEYDGEEGA